MYFWNFYLYRRSDIDTATANTNRKLPIFPSSVASHCDSPPVMVTTQLLLWLTEVVDFLSEAALTIRQQQMVPRRPPAVPPLLPPFLAG